MWREWMKITVFNGSPRGKNGNTNRIVEAFLRGAEKAGAETENIFLVEKTIEHCLGCFNCWDTTPGKCSRNDDVEALHSIFLASDFVVLASPVYTDNITSILKKFLERILSLVNPCFEYINGETRHTRRHDHYPDFIAISNCGYPEYSQFQVMSHFFKRLARETNVAVKLEIYRTMGELLKIKHILLNPVVNRYLKNVEKAGEQFVQNGAVDEKLLEKLKESLIPEKMYRKMANAHWKKKLSRL